MNKRGSENVFICVLCAFVRGILRIFLSQRRRDAETQSFLGRAFKGPRLLCVLCDFARGILRIFSHKAHGGHGETLSLGQTLDFQSALPPLWPLCALLRGIFRIFYHKSSGWFGVPSIRVSKIDV